MHGTGPPGLTQKDIRFTGGTDFHLHDDYFQYITELEIIYFFNPRTKRSSINLCKILLVELQKDKGNRTIADLRYG